MAQQIKWTPQALQDFTNTILFLEQSWSAIIADEFIAETENRLATLAQHPYIGIASDKIGNVRSILLTKQNRLYYRIEGNKLVVLSIFDIRQNPAKNNF